MRQTTVAQKLKSLWCCVRDGCVVCHQLILSRILFVLLEAFKTDFFLF